MTKCCPSFLLHKESILIVSKNINNILRRTISRVVLNITLVASLSSVAELLHAGGTNVPKHDSKQVECIVDMAYHEEKLDKGMNMMYYLILRED